MWFMGICILKLFDLPIQEFKLEPPALVFTIKMMQGPENQFADGTYDLATWVVDVKVESRGEFVRVKVCLPLGNCLR